MTKHTRAVAGIVILVLILFLPKWFYIPALLLALVFFPFYWEGVLFGFLVDVLYGQAHVGFNFSYPFALFAAVFVIVFTPLRKFFRLQSI